MKSLLWVGIFFPTVATGLSCTDWFNGANRDCCRATGICQSSSCTVFGYKSSAKTNCHTSGTDRNCVGSVCSYFNTKCIPVASTTTSGAVDTLASQSPHCYGTVACADGSQSCEGYGRLCLDDGSSSNFKICGDDICPTRSDGTCSPQNTCDRDYYWDGQQCQLNKCAEVLCSKTHEHCNSATGTCDCDDGWERVAGQCLADKCVGVSCPALEHCNAALGTCDCNDGYERVNGQCIVDKCVGVSCTADHTHCNSLSGSCVCDEGYVRDAAGQCEVDKCLGVTCTIAHQHCNPLTGQCNCDDGYFHDNDGDCEEDKCVGVTCSETNHEHCNTNTGACTCDEGYERVNSQCVEPCPVGAYRGGDYQCHVCNECMGANTVWDEKSHTCVCLPGYLLNAATGACDKIPPYPCIVNGEANLIKKKHGKAEDVVVGKMTIAYNGASGKFTVTYAITNADFPDLKFKKVWPRLRSRAPKDHSNPRWDSNWLKEYSKDTLPARYVEFADMPVPEFLCSMAPDVKSLYLSTQLQFWEPNNGGSATFRAANGYVDDGDVKSGRDRRDYRVVVQCVLDAAHCTACAGQCLGTGQHCMWNLDGDVSCQCDDGYTEAADGSCIPEDACTVNGETCPDNAHCEDKKPGAKCKCNPGYHERKHAKDGSLECVRKCMMNGGTALKVNGAGFAGKVDIILNNASNLTGAQYALVYTLSQGQIKSLYFQTSKTRADKHIPALFQNSIILSTMSSTLRFPADPNQWLTLDGTIDCTTGVDNVYHVSTQLGIINAGVGQKAWGKGKKTDDQNAQDFEFRVKCHPVCPEAANCQGCHDKAECVWDHSSSSDNKYGCKCYPGFKGDGALACDDIDECGLGVATVCGANSICTNTVGSYNCACNTKFVFDGVLGCVGSTTTLKGAEGEVAVDSDTATCSTPSWVWIVIGVLVTVLVIMFALLVVQYNRQRLPMFAHNVAEPRGEGAVPVPSTASYGYVSPAGLRRRPDSSTPKTTGLLSTQQYDPLANH